MKGREGQTEVKEGTGGRDWWKGKARRLELRWAEKGEKERR